MASQHARLLVLVAAEDADARDELGAALGADVDVAWADGIEKAIVVIAELEPDVVLTTDVGLIGAIRDEYRPERIPVVVVAADDQGVAVALRLGARDVLTRDDGPDIWSARVVGASRVAVPEVVD